jgi:hypothetical protein
MLGGKGKAAVALLASGLGLFLVAQTLPWGGAHVNFLIAQGGVDVFPWGAHTSSSGFGEKSDEWTNWYTGSNNLDESEPGQTEDSAPEGGETELSYTTGYASSAGVIVKVKLILDSTEWTAGKSSTGSVRFNLYEATSAKSVRIVAVWVNATDDLGGKHPLLRSTPGALVVGVGNVHTIPFSYTPGTWEGPIKVGVEANIVALLAAPSPSPTSRSTDAEYTTYNADFDPQRASVRVTTSSGSRTWFAGQPNSVNVTIELTSMTRVTSLDVTACALEADGEIAFTRTESSVLDAVGEKASYQFTASNPLPSEVRFGGQPSFIVHHADGSTRAVTIEQNGLYFGEIDVTVIPLEQPLEKEMFAFTIGADYAETGAAGFSGQDSSSTSAWAAVMQFSHPVQILGAILASISLSLVVASRTARRGNAIVAFVGSGVIGVGVLMFVLGLQNSLGNALGAFFDWSAGLFVGVAATGALVAGAILLLLAAPRGAATPIVVRAQAIPVRPSGSIPPRVMHAGLARAPVTASQPSAATVATVRSGAPATRQLKCPRCAHIISAIHGSKPRCSHCGFG